MLSIHIHTGDGKSVIDPPTSELFSYRADPGACIWVDLETPAHDEPAVVAKAFSLLDFTIEDLLKQGQRANSWRYSTG